jgi:hypothetical protein
MNVLKKIGVVLLSIVLISSISLFVFSFSTRLTLIKELKTLLIEDSKEDIAEDLDITKEEVDEFFANEDVSNFIDKYIDAFIYGMAGYNNLTRDDIRKDIVEVIDNNKEFFKEKLKVTDEDIDAFKSSEELDNITEELYGSFTEQEDETSIQVAKAYTNLISTSFKVKMFITICVLTLLIWLLQKAYFKTMKVFGICSIISSVVTAGAMALLTYLVQSVAEVEVSVNYMSGLIYSIVLLVIGIGLIVTGNILKKKVS